MIIRSMQPADLRWEAHCAEGQLFLIDGILKETVGEQWAFEGAGSKTMESPSPAAQPGSPSLLRGAQEETTPASSRAVVWAAQKCWGVQPIPTPLAVRGSPPPPSSGHHCACWWLQAGSWSKEALGTHPLASCAQSTAPDALPAHQTQILSLHLLSLETGASSRETR